MTRIFDALKKVQGTRSSALAPMTFPAPPAHAASARAAEGGIPARPALPAPALEPLTAVPALGDDVVREMSTLRVHLEAALPERNPRIVVFMSAQGGEGTTTVATQFALTLARDPSLRVLLVDAHARRPALSGELAGGGRRRSVFGSQHRAGREAALSHAERLRVLPFTAERRISGDVSAQGIRELYESVAGAFDWIVVDGPPVLESPDAAALAGAGDGVVIVVQAGRTKRPVLTRSADLLRKAGARVLGTVLNRRRLEIPEFIYRRI